MSSAPDNDAAFAQYTAVRDQIHDAFDRVALGLSCTLPMLLEETRARRIPDDSVRHVMVMDEVDAQAGEDSDRHFRCARSNAGVLYLTRDSAPPNAAALAFEAFAELWRDAQGGWSETQTKGGWGRPKGAPRRVGGMHPPCLAAGQLPERAAPGAFD